MMCTVDSSMVGPQWQSYETLSRLGCLEIPQFTVITTAAPAPWQRCRAQPGCFMIKVTAPAPCPAHSAAHTQHRLHNWSD